MNKEIGYVVMTASEYKDLILKANDRKEENKIIDVIEEENIFEKIVLNDLYENNYYHLKNTKEFNNGDYHYNELVMEFIKLGIKDFNYIHSQIIRMKGMYEKNKKGEMEHE